MSWVNIQNFDSKGYPIAKVYFAGGSSAPPTTRFAPNFNGVSQYASTPVIELTSDFSVTFHASFNSLTGTYNIAGYTGGGSEFRFDFANDRFRFIADGVFTTIDGVLSSINSQELNYFEVKRVGTLVTFSKNGLELGSGVNSGALMLDVLSQNGLGQRWHDGILCDFTVNDGSIYNFPMDDGWSNNPTMRNTGTGADGTFINMTEAAWVEIQS